MVITRQTDSFHCLPQSFAVDFGIERRPWLECPFGLSHDNLLSTPYNQLKYLTNLTIKIRKIDRIKLLNAKQVKMSTADK